MRRDDYEGIQDTTTKGKKCLGWGDTDKGRHTIKDNLDTTAHTLIGNNYCRDPENAGFIWCYVTDEFKKGQNGGWERCSKNVYYYYQEDEEWNPSQCVLQDFTRGAMIAKGLLREYVGYKPQGGFTTRNPYHFNNLWYRSVDTMRKNVEIKSSSVTFTDYFDVEWQIDLSADNCFLEIFIPTNNRCLKLQPKKGDPVNLCVPESGGHVPKWQVLKFYNLNGKGYSNSNSFSTYYQNSPSRYGKGMWVEMDAVYGLDPDHREAKQRISSMGLNDMEKKLAEKMTDVSITIEDEIRYLLKQLDQKSIVPIDTGDVMYKW